MVSTTPLNCHCQVVPGTGVQRTPTGVGNAGLTGGAGGADGAGLTGGAGMTDGAGGAGREGGAGGADDVGLTGGAGMTDGPGGAGREGGAWLTTVVVATCCAITVPARRTTVAVGASGPAARPAASSAFALPLRLPLAPFGPGSGALPRAIPTAEVAGDVHVVVPVPVLVLVRSMPHPASRHAPASVATTEDLTGRQADPPRRSRVVRTSRPRRIGCLRMRGFPSALPLPGEGPRHRVA